MFYTEAFRIFFFFYLTERCSSGGLGCCSAPSGLKKKIEELSRCRKKKIT
jgi:hypothetical protein